MFTNNVKHFLQNLNLIAYRTSEIFNGKVVHAIYAIGYNRLERMYDEMKKKSQKIVSRREFSSPTWVQISSRLPILFLVCIHISESHNPEKKYGVSCFDLSWNLRCSLIQY